MGQIEWNSKKSKYKGNYLILQDLLTNRINGHYFEVY